MGWLEQRSGHERGHDSNASAASQLSETRERGAKVNGDDRKRVSGVGVCQREKRGMGGSDSLCRVREKRRETEREMGGRREMKKEEGVSALYSRGWG